MNPDMSATSVRFPFPARAEVGLAAALFAVTLALFWPAQDFGYINLDDVGYVAENSLVADGLTREGVRQAFVGVREQWWLPLLWISFMADADLFGPGPRGHHLVNVLLHAANAALLFWALFRLTGSRWRSFFVAALFAWHPTRMEAVAWITARKDVLSGLFFMLALLAYARHAARPAARGLAWVFVLMLAGLMSKAILIVLPPVLLLLDFWPLKRAQRFWGAAAWREWKPLLLEKAPLVLLAAVFMGINLFTHTTGRGEGAPTSLATRLGMIAPNYVDYLQLVAAPIRLSILYPESDVVSWPYALAALAALAAATWAIWRWRDQRPYWTVGWLWFLVALLPVVRGVRMGLAQYANRWTYLPLIGLAIALAWTAAEWSGRPRARRWIGLACGLALVLCLARTRAQLPWWHDTLTVFGRAVYLNPDLHFPRNTLGVALVEAGQVEAGAAQIREAIRLKPTKTGYVDNLGSALLKLGRAQEALAWHDEAIRLGGEQLAMALPEAARLQLESEMPDYHNNRGQALAALGRKDEARAAYEEALRLAPAHPEAHYNLGYLLYGAGRAAEALPHFQAAVAGRSGTAPMWYNLGMACAQVGRYAEADSCVAKALSIDPGLEGAAAALAKIRLLRF